MEKNMVEHVRSEFLDNLPPYLAYYLTFDIVEFERLEGIDKPTIRFMLDVKQKVLDKTVLRILIACALEDSTVRLFDVSGKKCLSKIRYSTRQTSPRGYTNDSSASCLTAMRFHESKVLIGIALNDNSFSAYGVPSL
uniref:Uncharacterized protein n=1 Tax=Ditylenchus dipsaci TaxID=166011 RepID=A0A915CZ16_9BILA